MPPPPRPTKTGTKPWLKGDVDDLVSLSNLDEAILLEELHCRYDKKKIYTYVGDILVAVNPFEQLPIYTKQHQLKYNDTVKSKETPHIFAMADQAYHNLIRNGKNQCAVISGESGAGKTESAKLLMKHIIHLCHSGSEGEDIEQRIIEVNPLLEAFGNAATRMNHNSSRFGKYTELDFEPNGAVVGAKISQYLLEKSRVVKQNSGENNFHMFYYMFSSPSARALGLTNPKDFPYLSASKKTPPNCAGMYQGVMKALDTVGFSPDEQQSVHAIIASILHLSKITFSEARPDEAQVSSPPAVLSQVANFLGVKGSELSMALTTTSSYTRGELIRKNYTCEKAVTARDAFAKALYGRLFAWIVTQINELLTPSGMDQFSSYLEIGILDIFGFEHFEKNGFEQLCINIANEQLQAFFNEHIFQSELEEYRKEGIDGSNITYKDNQGLLDVFFGRPVGILSLLDEECRFPRATDITLIDKFKDQFSQHPDYTAPRTNEPCFTISHYAGAVKYHSDGFLERNRDELSPDVTKLCIVSSVSVVHNMFSDEEDEKSGAGTMNTARKRAKTVSYQFADSLRVLMSKMKKCMAHFVRCIKPNTNQAANLFVDEFVNRQLKYTGMLETTRIRREGYSFRPTFGEFMERWGILAYAPTASITPTRDTCKCVLEKSNIANWLLGKTKVFLRYWQVEQLDKSIKLFHDYAKVLQKVANGFLVRQMMKRIQMKKEQQVREIKSFLVTLSRVFVRYSEAQNTQNVEDMRRFAAGIKPKPSLPPIPQKSESELKREASVLWWKEKEAPKGAGQKNGDVLPWFHGLITRQESEQLLKPRFVGTFLVRVSENRFGYTLSYRVSDRCRHYIIEQDTRGNYKLHGIPKICTSLNGLIEWFSRHRINKEGDMLREACGQFVNPDTGIEECNYGELLPPPPRGGKRVAMPPPQSNAPPPVRRDSKPPNLVAPVHGQSSDPPLVRRSSKPPIMEAAPPIVRSNKPRF
eukprot:m.17655 g.17655  ORF g.17655 m.17655 type:complete len:983 (-) comp4818_c1_seq1:285-3233(-)